MQVLTSIHGSSVVYSQPGELEMIYALQGRIVRFRIFAVSKSTKLRSFIDDFF